MLENANLHALRETRFSACNNCEFVQNYEARSACSEGKPTNLWTNTLPSPKVHPTKTLLKASLIYQDLPNSKRQMRS
jgi:hypothetical protein